MAAYEELFKDKEYCLKTLAESRKIAGNKNTTREQFDQLEKCLGLMYLYCPENIQDLVMAFVDEAARRRIHFELNFWPAQAVGVA